METQNRSDLPGLDSANSGASGAPGVTPEERVACNTCSKHACSRGFAILPRWTHTADLEGRWPLHFTGRLGTCSRSPGPEGQSGLHLQVCVFPTSACLSERAKLNTLTDTKFIFPGLLFQNGCTNYWPFFLVILIIRNTFFSVASSLSAYYRNKALLKPTG